MHRYAGDMKRSAAFVVVTAGLIGGAGTGCAACAPGDCNSTEPTYAGDANDETWRVMLDARGSADESDDVNITSPAEGDTVPAGEPATLTWTSELEVAALHGRGMTPLPSFRRPRPGLFERLGATLLPVAHAHLPPITSDLYFVEVDVPDRACPVAGLTTDESFVFADGDWEAIATGGGERTLRILSAFVTENRVTEGPFLASPVTFTVEE